MGYFLPDGPYVNETDTTYTCARCCGDVKPGDSYYKDLCDGDVICLKCSEEVGWVAKDHVDPQATIDTEDIEIAIAPLGDPSDSDFDNAS